MDFNSVAKPVHMKRFSLFFLLFLLAGCQPEKKGIYGYVEGEFLFVSSTSSGFLEALSVKRGQDVRAGDPLFALNDTNLLAARDAAIAEVEKAQAQWNDLTKGERPEEIDILLNQKAQAEAELANARREYERKKPLTKTGATSQASLDNSRAAYDVASARVREISARLKTSAMGAREDQLNAAKAASDMAEQNLVKAKQVLMEAAPKSPVDGRVEDTFFLPGEYVAAGAPVVSILSPENLKIRFFVSQAVLPKLNFGQSLKIKCDGCKAPIPAKVSFIAHEAEYTPPVIFSVESRDKLVFMIEAVPEQADMQLKPGLPVTIELGNL